MASEQRAGRRKGRRRDRGGRDLEASLLQRYTEFGVSVLADPVPRRLDPTLRRELETVVGADLDEVRIHTGERAQKMAESLGARAFAAGPSDVFFAQGEFAPQTPAGKALLAHELAHVVEGQPGLSRRPRKAQVEDLELRARKVEEMVLAKEQEAEQVRPDQMLEPETLELPPLTEPQSAAQPIRTTVDKALLEDKILEVMEREARRDRERRGQ
jgi:hypothetical protein